MSEIEKARARKNVSESQAWLFFASAMGLVAFAMVLSNQMGVIAGVWLSMLVYLIAFSSSDRRLHKELVQEIDALRLELEQLKASR